MTAKKADMCPIAYDLCLKFYGKDRKKKVFCGFYSMCERPDRGRYSECKKVDEK